MYGSGKKLSKSKTQKKSEENIIKVWKIVLNYKKKIIKKKENDNKGEIIRYIRTILEEEDDSDNQIRAGNCWNNSYIKYESDTWKKYISNRIV